MKYTVNRGSQEIGKFELADIQALMNAGVILPTDYFWFQGMSEWKPVSSLFAAQPSAVPQVVVPPLPAAQHAPAGQVVMTKEVGPSCPSCHSTDVIKAHAAYEASLQQHSLSAGTSSGFRLWAGGESINKVGVKCAPPTKPADVDNTPSERMATLIFGMVGITFSLMGGVDVLHQNKNPLILIGGLGGLGLSFWFYKRWQKQIEMDQAANLKIKNRFKAEMADYVRTWRCNKCGVMYRI
jgi:positive regulator of sigma E activity